LFLALHFRRPSSLSANEREEKEKEKETGTKMHLKLILLMCCEGMLHINNINCIRGNTLMPSLVAAAAAAAA
jgi:hypothetical protein